MGLASVVHHPNWLGGPDRVERADRSGHTLWHVGAALVTGNVGLADSVTALLGLYSIVPQRQLSDYMDKRYGAQ